MKLYETKLFLKYTRSFLRLKYSIQLRIIGAVPLSLYVSHMLLVSMTRDLAHMQLSDLQGEIRPICETSELQGRKNAYMPNVIAIFPIEMISR